MGYLVNYFSKTTEKKYFLKLRTVREFFRDLNWGMKLVVEFFGGKANKLNFLSTLKNIKVKPKNIYGKNSLKIRLNSSQSKIFFYSEKNKLCIIFKLISP